MKCPRSDILEFLQGVLLISFPVPLYAFHLSLYSGKGIAQFVLQVLIRIQLHPVQIAHRTTRIFTLRGVNLISFQNVFQCSGICFFFLQSEEGIILWRRVHSQQRPCGRSHRNSLCQAVQV